MAKATLEFDLDDFDDRVAHLRAVQSTTLALAVWEFLRNTRKGIEWQVEKLEEEGMEVTAYDSIDFVYEKFVEILNDANIDIDKLIV